MSYCGEMPEADVFAPTFVDSDAMRVVAREKKVRGKYRFLHVNIPAESMLFLVAWVA